MGMHGRMFDALVLGTKSAFGKMYTGVPVGAIDRLLPRKAVCMTMTFDRGASRADSQMKNRVEKAQLKASTDRGNANAINMKLGEMEEKKQKIPADLEREADRANIAYGRHEHMTKMLSDHDPFHAGRHATRPEDAANGQSLHPVIQFICHDVQRTYHMLESADHDYTSIGLHVLPLLKQIEQVLGACAFDAF